MKNKKVLILHSSNDLYGASKVLVQVIDILTEIGYEIFLILPYEGPLNSLLNKKANISIKNLGIFRKKYFNFFGILNRLYKILIALFFLNKIIRTNNIDVVYSNTSVIVAGGIIAKINGIKSYFHIHEIPKNSFYKILIKNFINIFSDKVIVVSDAVKNHWFSLDNHNVFKIYNGLNFKIQKISKQRTTVFTSIARLIPYKGHVYFIEIANKLLKKNPNLMFYIIGDTFKGYEDYEKKLKNLVKLYDLQNKIIFTGYRNDVSDFFNKTHFFLHTTIEPDPLPTVIIESMMLEIPVIATNTGGAIELLNHGKSGLLIPVDDVDCSVKLIEEYMLNYKLQKEKIKFGLNNIKQNFSYDLFKKNIIKFFID